MIVVTYHNVLAHVPNAFNLLARKEWLTLDRFAHQIDAIARRYRVVPLRQAVDALARGEELADGCAITFDDGNLGAYRHAAPLLESRGLPAAFFAVTGRLDGARRDAYDVLEALLQLTEKDALDLGALGYGRFPLTCDECKLRAHAGVAKRLKTAGPDERARALAEAAQQLDVAEGAVEAYLAHEAYQSMTWDDLRDLAARGFEIGSHTRTHVSLAALTEAELEAEVTGSYRDLVERLGPAAYAFTYPYGKAKHLSGEAVAAVRAASFSCGLTMERGANVSGTDVFRMRRMVYKDLKRRPQGVSIA